jgi:iron complex outermembrane receptor protein
MAVRRTIACGFAVTLAAASSSGAQTPYRQTVVVTAAAVPIELGSATRTLTVITREQIAQMPATSIADVLRLASSVDVRARGTSGTQVDFAVRGAGFGQMLVLVDGVRMNDAQSGHHNGDIPVPLGIVERIEIMYGAGSSLFGADAFGGTINVITRRSMESPTVSIRGASFGAVSVRGAGGLRRGSVSQTVAGSVERSSGFVEGRDFTAAVVRSQTSIGDSSGISVSLLRKEFGARNFYGATALGDAMSREWTSQLLLAADHVFGTFDGWTFRGDASYRAHGDRFRFTPASVASTHRTHEVLGSVAASRSVQGAGRVTFGAEGGGNSIRSNNLGNHTLGRVSGFGEWRHRFAHGVEVDAGLRGDHYDVFGSSWSPSAGIAWWPRRVLRVRASGGRAFRIPTFTERYYSDPNHLARADVGPEHSWGGEGGADLFMANGWTMQATWFRRSDSDVIDWLCADLTCGRGGPERWHTFNVRDVTTTGTELSVRRTFGGRAFAQVEYTWLAVRAPSVAAMAKYVADYSPGAFAATAALKLPAALHLAPRVEIRRRQNSSGTADYVVMDARMSRPLRSALSIAVDATNLLNARYEEIPGVRMPSRSIGVSLSVGAQ